MSAREYIGYALIGLSLLIGLASTYHTGKVQEEGPWSVERTCEGNLCRVKLTCNWDRCSVPENGVFSVEAR